jgi:hypothetical protein
LKIYRSGTPTRQLREYAEAEGKRVVALVDDVKKELEEKKKEAEHKEVAKRKKPVKKSNASANDESDSESLSDSAGSNSESESEYDTDCDEGDKEGLTEAGEMALALDVIRTQGSEAVLMDAQLARRIARGNPVRGQEQPMFSHTAPSQRGGRTRRAKHPNLGGM